MSELRITLPDWVIILFAVWIILSRLEDWWKRRKAAQKKECVIKKITPGLAELIVDTRYPKGKFWLKENKRFVGINNSTGHAWMEDFKTKRECIKWLKISDK